VRRLFIAIPLNGLLHLLVDLAQCHAARAFHLVGIGSGESVINVASVWVALAWHQLPESVGEDRYRSKDAWKQRRMAWCETSDNKGENMTTLSKIEERVKKLQARADAIQKKQAIAAVAKIRSLMKEHGLTIDDLTIRGRTGAANDSANAPLAAARKYRDPKTGATWSGRGRAPAWIANAKNRARFLVSAAVEPNDSDSGKRTGNDLRGPQPAKYRDPKSGAEWSGRGKAPGWLASVKGRSRFLISTADTKAAGTVKPKSEMNATPARSTQTRKTPDAGKAPRAKRT
jgi:DNA-binding protein H-NS